MVWDTHHAHTITERVFRNTAIKRRVMQVQDGYLVVLRQELNVAQSEQTQSRANLAREPGRYCQQSHCTMPVPVWRSVATWRARASHECDSRSARTLASIARNSPGSSAKRSSRAASTSAR